MGISSIYMLLNKKEFLKMVEPGQIKEFKKMKIKELRNHFNITHKINDKFINANGLCYKCLRPIRLDHTSFKNYCEDC